MENQIQPQPYWADFKIKVGSYADALFARSYSPVKLRKSYV